MHSIVTYYVQAQNLHLSYDYCCDYQRHFKVRSDDQQSRKAATDSMLSEHPMSLIDLASNIWKVYLWRYHKETLYSNLRAE